MHALACIFLWIIVIFAKNGSKTACFLWKEVKILLFFYHSKVKYCTIWVNLCKKWLLFEKKYRYLHCFYGRVHKNSVNTAQKQLEKWLFLLKKFTKNSVENTVKQSKNYAKNRLFCSKKTQKNSAKIVRKQCGNFAKMRSILKMKNCNFNIIWDIL